MKKVIQLVADTSARSRAWNAFDDAARADAQRWGWDHPLIVVHEVMGLVKQPQGGEGVIWRLGNSEGWPAVLHRIAELMEEAGIRCDVFDGTDLSDEALESAQAADAVDPSAPDTGKPPTRDKESA